MTTFTINYWNMNSKEHETIKVETFTETEENTLDAVKQHAADTIFQLGWKYAYSIKIDTTTNGDNIMKQ